MRTFRRYRGKLGGLARIALLLVGALSACDSPSCNPTYGTEWQGDDSSCKDVAADVTIQTIGGDVGGLYQEFGAETPDYPGHDGCQYGFVIDYLMPAPLTNVNPGWDWAWMHVASRVPGVDQALCEQLWTSLKVYAYWTYQGVDHDQLLLETYRKGKWITPYCDFGLPDNVWMSSVYTRVRAVSQHGGWFIPLQPHYSYFVTNLN